MKLFFIAAILFVGFSLGAAFAQQGPPGVQPPAPSVSDLDQQLQDVGCRAERNAAATTIVNLQKQITDLKAQLQKADPPKSGATKH